ncbi:MAG: glycosyltransferase family 2 protein [Chloroflexi bacterium]|nr:glycosyltransferase family 2 protein [Chloroflexota bacterium]
MTEDVVNRAVSSRAADRAPRTAPPQILAHERGYAVVLSLLFFALWGVPLWGPFLMPAVLAYVVAAYNCYWTAQALYGAWCAVRGLRIMARWMRIDWQARYKQTGRPVQHVVVLPNYDERIEILRQTLDRLALAEYPREQISVVLAMEDRETGSQEKAELLSAEYAGRFGHFWITLHPLLPDETAGKGANLAYCLRQISKRAEELGWDPSQVMVTTLDADTRLHPQFLAALAVRFLEVPDPTRKFFQGMLMLINNVWDVFAPTRVLAAFWTFTYVAASTHYQRMTTAVYSMSLRLLQDAGYWDPRVVAEDGHIFFRAFFALQGRPDIEQIFLPVGLDAVRAPTMWQSLVVQFRQMQRWAWTASILPFVLDAWLHRRAVPLSRKFAKVLPYVEGLVIMPSSWFVITFGVLLPPLLNPQMPTDVFGVPLAVLAPLILSPTLIGVVVALSVNIMLRNQFAQRSARVPWPQRVVESIEWGLMLFVAVFYFGIPYVQAYWRMISGNELHFERTPK